jgi:hypothetical protein
MKRKIGTCQLCGEEAELTKDHLPQKGLYPSSIRSSLGNLNTVWACAPCNNSQNLIDEVVKVIVGPIATAPWKSEIEKSVSRTLEKNRKLKKMFDEHTRFEVVDTEQGRRHAGILKLPPDKAKQFVAGVVRIAKGLFFQEYGVPLVEKYEISLFHPQATDELQSELETAMMKGPWKSVNDDTIHYCFSRLPSYGMVCVINLFENVELCFSMLDKGWREKYGISSVLAEEYGPYGI